METVLICIIAGMGAGLGTGFAGMSAAVVISPMLVSFLGMNAFEAIGIALASDVLASAASAYTYGKNKNIDLKRSKSLFVSVLVFTLIGAFVAHLVPATTMGDFTVYGCVLMGINFLMKSFKDEAPKQHKEYTGIWKKLLPILCGALIGFICGFIGAGGGIMMLMLLTAVLHYELKTAVGTSVFIMTFTALFGATSHFALNGVFPDVTVLLLCISSTLFFATLGARFANKAQPKVLNRATGIVLLTLGVFMVASQYITAL
ncbi:sulfite exporter TauE/SafE family protein [Tannockella kyphosi]|uniref:sulfite exporter TauE/SafE family protein n=1 Tax=Tannockella kyphosi TaxID=2899121 RepID=UPI002011BF2C|nr:sulfite exporter TauE/SafE family protein [Tannockella kyphosi]